MSRLTLVCVLAVCISISIIVAEAKKKDKWREKKSHLRPPIPSRDALNGMEKNKKEVNGEILGKIHRGFDNWLSKKKWRKTKSRRGKHHKKSKSRKRKGGKITKNMPWLNFLSGDDCEPKCTKEEICILGPLEAKPLCVHFKDLKKSMKLFRKYKKKEKKAWEKFHKKNYSHFKGHDVLDFTNEKRSKGSDMENKKLAMEKALMKKQEFLNSARKQEREEPPVAALEPTEGGDHKACNTEDFSQMRTRIMGWFHLLHSQDKRVIREQRRRKGHKHSVKKQLEAGDKCQCMKSAVYEFDQMDEDGDDLLTDREMAILEENGMEPCMKPYITSCDRNGDNMLSSAEWCCCFSNVLGPCYSKMDEIRKSGEQVTYMPRCDKEGYYMPEQCKRVDLDKFSCWCVDFNGNIKEGTKRDGRAHCSKFMISEKYRGGQ